MKPILFDAGTKFSKNLNEEKKMQELLGTIDFPYRITYTYDQKCGRNAE